MNDLINRQDVIDALWKALYEYEDKTEKQFIESDELDVEDWVQHRIFVQNMNDIDRQTILDLPSAQQWIPCSKGSPEEGKRVIVQYGDGSLGVIERVSLKIWNLINSPYAKVVAWTPAPEPWGDEDEQLC